MMTENQKNTDTTKHADSKSPNNEGEIKDPKPMNADQNEEKDPSKKVSEPEIQKVERK